MARLAPPVFALGGEAPKWPPPAPYWLTCDSDPDDGQIFDVVDVWTSVPERLVNAGVAGAYWLTKAEWDITTWYGRYTRASMARWLGTVPDDDYMVIRVG